MNITNSVQVWFGDRNEPEIPKRKWKPLLKYKEKYPGAGIMVLTNDYEEEIDGIKFTPVVKFLLGLTD